MLIALLLLTHIPYQYISMGTVAVMQCNPKGAFSTNSSFDKSSRGESSTGVPCDRTLLLFSFKYFVWVKYW